MVDISNGGVVSGEEVNMPPVQDPGHPKEAINLAKRPPLLLI